MKSILSLSILVLSLAGTFTQVARASTSDDAAAFFKAIDSLRSPKMCVLEAYKTGATYLSCDGASIRAELSEDYRSVNLTRIGALLLKKGVALKNCAAIRGFTSAAATSDEREIGQRCFFAI